MKTGSGSNRVIIITGLSIMALSAAVKWLSYFAPTVFLHKSLRLLTSFLFLLLFFLWGRTLRYRVIQKHIRFCLTTIAGLEFLWALTRVVKWDFYGGGTVGRYLWYLYYLPTLGIPVLLLFLAISMGKPESYRPKKFLWLFPALSLLLFGMVMTNDLHSLVFVIPPGEHGMETGNYTYGMGYTAVMVYIYLCALASYGILFCKCRVRAGRLVRLLPLILLFVGIIVGGLYATGHHVLFGFYHLDISMIICFYTTAALEACIQSGLILTNHNYDELFRLGSIRAVITDREYMPLISSKRYSEIPVGDMRRAGEEGVMLENGMRLSCAPIEEGYVLWQDDLSELDGVVKELSEIRDYLQGKNDAIRQAYDYQKRERQLLEKNRLYNRILTHTKPEIECYAGLIEELAAETDPLRETQLAVRIAFVSAFIKRRDNLIFLSEEEKPIASSELFYCVEESLSNLRLGGVQCYCSYNLDTPMDFSKLSRMYESFYKILFALTDTLSSVCVYLIEEGNVAVLLMRISLLRETDLFDFGGEDVRVEREEREWVVTCR